VNYLQALLSDKRTDVVFYGYQAAGTLGRDIQAGCSSVTIDDQRVEVNARVHSMSGYSAHADQQDLLAFVAGCSSRLKQVYLIHGEAAGKVELADVLHHSGPFASVIC
jgi:metallo-beta-lactamase family protein